MRSQKVFQLLNETMLRVQVLLLVNEYLCARSSLNFELGHDPFPGGLPRPPVSHDQSLLPGELFVENSRRPGEQVRPDLQKPGFVCRFQRLLDTDSRPIRSHGHTLCIRMPFVQIMAAVGRENSIIPRALLVIMES